MPTLIVIILIRSARTGLRLDGRAIFLRRGRAAPIPIGFPRQGRPLAVAPRPSQARPGLLT